MREGRRRCCYILISCSIGPEKARLSNLRLEQIHYSANVGQAVSWWTASFQDFLMGRSTLKLSELSEAQAQKCFGAGRALIGGLVIGGRNHS
jgi:hypothetical protein